MSSPFSAFQKNQSKPNKNLGIPKKQYIQIKKLNDIYSSYKYSITAATQSKAKAAAQYRSQAFSSALNRAFDSSVAELTNAQKSDLILEEKEFLKRGKEYTMGIVELQTVLTELIVKDEMKNMDVVIGEVDIPSKKDTIIDATIVEDDKASDTTEETTPSTKEETAFTTKKEKNEKTEKKSGSSKKEINKLVKEIEKTNTEMLRLEMEFIRAVVEIMGPDRANAIRAALIGNITGGGAGTAGGLLNSLQERPLSQIINTFTNTADSTSTPPLSNNLFVTDFPGDVTASQVATLREEVTAIIQSAKEGDEALILLKTGGGTVTGYGLAAAQLQRFKNHGMKLTICVEEVAASGGYMMTCVADRVVASPFAVLGSIGVISDLPNVYERLKQEGIEFQTVTAGKYKRTLTPTKKVTKEDVEKQKEELENILTLFKGFVKENRPSLDIETVATGETWVGQDALEKGLCDELATVDDVLVDYVEQGYNVYQVRYNPDGLESSPLSNLLPIGSISSASTASGTNEGGVVRGAVRWMARNVLPTIRDEIVNEFNSVASSTSGSQVQQRYKFQDPSNTSKNIKVED